VLTTPLMDIARSALRIGTTTALAWMLVSIGVATGEGVAGVWLEVGGVETGFDDGPEETVGAGVGPPSSPE